MTARESGQTSTGSFLTRELEEPTDERKQMTAQAGALSLEATEGHALNWEAINRNVRRLQARIVKATQEGRWGKVKALQHLLTHSFSGKALAVRRVTENQGKYTPGVDQQMWNTPTKKAAAIHALKQRGYQPRPLRRVYIPKKSGIISPALANLALNGLEHELQVAFANSKPRPNAKVHLVRYADDFI